MANIQASRINFTLVENAAESFYHALTHLTIAEDPPSDLKRAVLDLVHVIELLAKEALSRVHPSFIWEDIDRFPNPEARKVGLTLALRRLETLSEIRLRSNEKKSILLAAEIRNKFTHYQIEFDEKELKALLGGLTAFILKFASDHLGLPWESSVKKDASLWDELILFEGFWAEHAARLRSKLEKAGVPTVTCSNCGQDLVDISTGTCECGHAEKKVLCEWCDREHFEFQMQNVGGKQKCDECYWGEMTSAV